MTKEKDTVEKYMRPFEKRLKIKNEKTRDQMIKEIERAVLELHGSGKSLDDIIEIMGKPNTLAATISNPENWYMEMGTPTKPQVPIKSILGHRGRIMIFSAFMMALLLSGIMIVSGQFSLLVPVLIALTITIWALMAAWFNQFLGYLITLRDLSKSSLNISAISKKKMIGSIMGHFGFSVLISVVIILSPLLVDRNSLFFSVPLGSVTIIGSIVMSMMVYFESNRLIED